MKHTANLDRKGFTLTEILVVLAVIATLAAILFPVFERIKVKGQQTTCMSNLKQMALAIKQYVRDNDSHYPQLSSWKSAVVTYSKNSQILQCPTEREKFSLIFLSPPYPSNYGYNIWLDEGIRNAVINGLPTATSNLGGTSEAVLTKESVTYLNSDSDPDGQRGEGRTACGYTRTPIVHSGGNNYSFIDGHVKWLTPQQAGEAICSTISQ